MLSAASISGFVLVGICAIAVGMLFDPLIDEIPLDQRSNVRACHRVCARRHAQRPLFAPGHRSRRFTSVMIAGVAMVGLGFCTVAASSTLMHLCCVRADRHRLRRRVLPGSLCPSLPSRWATGRTWVWASGCSQALPVRRFCTGHQPVDGDTRWRSTSLACAPWYSPWRRSSCSSSSH